MSIKNIFSLIEQGKYIGRTAMMEYVVDQKHQFKDSSFRLEILDLLEIENRIQKEQQEKNDQN